MAICAIYMEDGTPGIWAIFSLENPKRHTTRHERFRQHDNKHIGYIVADSSRHYADVTITSFSKCYLYHGNDPYYSVCGYCADFDISPKGRSKSYY